MNRIYLTPFNFKAIILYHKLISQGKKVSGFLDANSYLWNKSYEDIGIYQRCYLSDAVVTVCAETPETNLAIINELKELGYNGEAIQIYNEVIYDRFVDNVNIDQLLNILPKSNYYLMGVVEDFSKLKKMHECNIDTNNISYNDLFGLNRREVFGNKIFLNKLEVTVTHKCSLKCRKCVSGMQYFDKPTDFDVDQIIKDYGRALKLIDWVDRIVIIGGEPFICQDLGRLLEEMHNDPNTRRKVGAIKIITNGTVIPCQRVLQAIHDYDVTIWISNYGEKSKKICELIEAFRKEEINYSILNIKSWSDVIQLNNERKIQSEECLINRRKNDCVTRCRTIAGGKFYLCSLLKTMDCLGITPFTSSDYVDLYAEDARDKISKMLDMKRPLPNACSFCTGCSEQAWNDGTIEVAEQVQKPLPYIRERV